MPGILIELKVLRGIVAPENVTEKLTALSETALHQIDKKNYAFVMQDEGVTQVMKMGIAFYKKQAEITYRLDQELYAEAKNQILGSEISVSIQYNSTKK